MAMVSVTNAQPGLRHGTVGRAGPRGLPVVGIAHELRKDPLRYFVDVMLEYGDVVHFRIGMSPVIMLSHPDDIRHVLQDNYINYPKSRFYKSFKPILGRSIFTSEGETWKSQRLTAKPSFAGPRFGFMAERIVAATASMLERWHGLERDGQSVELVYEMMRLTLDGVTRALLDMRLVTEYEQLHDALTVVLRETERNVWSVVRLPPWLGTLTRPRYRRAVATLDRIIWGVIEERRRNPRMSDGLLSVLVEAHDRERSGDEQLLRDQVLAMIATGHESTACALAWTFYLLTRNPNAERRLYQEVDRVLEGRAPTADDLGDLQYTGMVFEEAMRLYPPVWTISRVARTDDRIRGTLIPRGTTVMLSPYATHRRPASWERPEAFVPERFAPDAKASRPRYAYFPFGGGPRVCLGNRFALMEAKIMLAMVAQRYRLSVCPGQAITAEPMITLRPRDGIRVRLTRRDAEPAVRHHQPVRSSRASRA